METTRRRRSLMDSTKDAGNDVKKTLKRKTGDSTNNTPNKIIKGSNYQRYDEEANKASAIKNHNKIIKRKKSSSENALPNTAFNGSKEDKSALDVDEESPNKMRRLSGSGVSSDESEDMDVQVENGDCDEDMEEEQKDSFCHPDDGKNRGNPYDSFSECQSVNRDRSRTAVKEDICGQENYLATSYHHTNQVGTATFGTDVRRYGKDTEDLTRPRIKTSSFVTAEAFKGIAVPVNRIQIKSCPRSAVPFRTQHQKHQISSPNQSAGKSKKGVSALLCFGLILLSVVLLGILVVLFPVQIYLPMPADILHSKTETGNTFESQFMKLESQFPSQRAEFWKRSKIHFSRRLQAEGHAEPVSVMLTSGRRAEKTLHCVAVRMASALSSALNASVVQIDGTSKALLDSDKVKLDIDETLTGAFKGHRGIAVIHRFEEFPPGSTLIFYKYCDHENAAFRNALLIFTVLLPVDELGAELSFKAAEEMVQDYTETRLLTSDQPASFDRMDVNKLSGLWSRISHLILPVTPDADTEMNGCQI